MPPAKKSGNEELLVWADPPPPVVGTGARYVPVIEELKAHPNKWAISPFHYSSMASAANFAARVSRGHNKLFGHKFEAVARRVGGEAKVFLRYVPQRRKGDRTGRENKG